MVCLGLSLISGKTASTKKARWPSRINNPLWWRLNGILGNVLLYRHWTTYWLLLHCIASHCRSCTIIVLECQMISFVLLSLFQPRFIDVCLYALAAFLVCFNKSDTYIPFNAIPVAMAMAMSVAIFVGMVCVSKHQEKNKKKWEWYHTILYFQLF